MIKLGILSCNTGCYSTQRLCEAARDRGHTVKVLDTVFASWSFPKEAISSA